jgi:DNA-binding PadR family transcriptional regulator
MPKHFLHSLMLEHHRHHRGHFGGREGFFDRWKTRGGPGFRPSKLVSSEDLQIVILALLGEKPRHGYEIIKAVEERSSGLYTPSPGMIYPALTYLEEASLAVSKVEGTKKLFNLTDEGTNFLKENQKRADEILEQLARFGEKMSHFQEQMAQEEETDEKWGGTSKEQEKTEWRQMKAEFHDLKHELKAALFEKLTSSLEEKKRVLDILKKAINEIREK